MNFFTHLGRFLLMLKGMFSKPENFRMYWKEFMHQCVEIGMGALPIVIIISLFLGAVTTIQTAYQLVSPLVPQSTIAQIVRDSMILELSPTVLSIVLAGVIGSKISSELSNMRVTEQIDAMEVSGTNPFKYLIVTRVLAATIMVPLLSSVANAISLYGGYLGTNLRGDVSWSLYWFQVFNSLSFGDVVPSLIKTIFFGFAIGIVGCYKGYYSQKGTEGVGRSATTAVIVASLLVFIIDLLVVQITDLLGLT